MNHFITPNWPAPVNIKAYTTLRTGGISQTPYQAFNLAEHVGDNPEHVTANRQILSKLLALPNEPIWLEQTHSTRAVPAISAMRHQEADAAFTEEAQQVCIVLTADCLPILLCQKNGAAVAAIHAGWRGLANGIITETLQAMRAPAEETLVWLGPAIGANIYEVGEEVRAYFIKKDPEAGKAFKPSPNGRWLADLYGLAKLQLNKQGIFNIYGGEYCTYTDQDKFFSYRREGAKTGRMASLIWRTE